MFLRLVLFFSCICFAGFTVRAQGLDPLTLSKKVFSRDSFPEIKKYSTGEYEGHPNGLDLSPQVETSFTLLDQNSNTAVVNVTIRSPKGYTLDTYLHFRKDSVWKVCAFRALAMTGVIEKVNEELKALTPAQVDSIIKSRPGKGKHARMFASRQEYAFQLGNTGLTLAADQTLIAHFRKNEQAFEQVKAELLAKNAFGNVQRRHPVQTPGQIKQQLNRLLIDAARPGGEGDHRRLDFVIGGIIDNAVGYLYIENPKDVPEMSPDNYIMIRNLGHGWYLYKTT